MRISVRSRHAFPGALAAAWALGLLLGAAPAGAEVLPSDVIRVEDVGGAIQAASSVLADGYLGKAACAVLPKHGDRYDVLFVYTTIPQGLFTGTQAGITVYQVTRGIGKPPRTDQRAKFCSTRLKHAVKMNEIAKQPADPDDPLPDRPEVGLSAVQVMAHELGHYWLAHASYDRGDGMGQHCNLRAMVATEGGAGNCDGYAVSDFGLHWSPFLDSGAVMFGNQIEDRGDGTFRFFNDGNAHFGRLDQYLMGLRPAEQVGEILLVRHDGFSGIGTADYPLPIGTEKIVTGWRVDVDIQDVIRFEGERFPVADPCHWKGAAVIVYATGKPPSQADVARVAAHATRFETYYAEATEGLGSIDLTIDGRGAGTATCPAPGYVPPDDAGGGQEDAASVPDDGAVVEPMPDAADEPGPPADDSPAVDRGSPSDSLSDAPALPDGWTGPACLAGAKRCDPARPGVAQACAADGRSWVDVADCGASERTCEAGACRGGGGGCSARALPGGVPGSPAPGAPLLLLIVVLTLVVSARLRQRKS